MSIRRGLVYPPDEFDNLQNNKVKMRVYPSNADKTAFSQKYNHSSQMSPHELKQLELRFKDLPKNKRPYLMSEHSTNEKDRLGRITNVYYNSADKWLWADATIFPEKKEEFKQFMHGTDENPGGGVSLCYEVSRDIINLREISCVKRGDFSGARVEVCHSKEGVAFISCPLNSGFFSPLDDALRMSEDANTNNQRNADDDVGDCVYEHGSGEKEGESGISSQIISFGSGNYVVSHSSLVDPAREYLENEGVKNPNIIVEDVSEFDKMEEGARRAMLASLIHSGRRQHSSMQEETERKAQEDEIEEMRSAVETTRSILPQDISGFSDRVIKAIGENIRLKPDVRTVAKISAQTIEQERERAATLMSEKKKLEAENRDLIERVKMLGGGQPKRARVEHGGASKPPVIDFMSFWKDSLKTPSAFAHSSSSSSSSSSSAQSGARRSAKRSEPETPRSSSSSSSSFPSHAKKVEHSAPKKSTEQELYEKHTWNGFSLFPDPATSSETQIICHSASKEASLRKTIDPERVSPLQISSDFMEAIRTGRRDVGPIPRDLFENNMMQTWPQGFTALLHSFNTGAAETNGQVGLRGLKEMGKAHKWDAHKWAPRIDTSQSTPAEFRITDLEKFDPTSRDLRLSWTC